MYKYLIFKFTKVLVQNNTSYYTIKSSSDKQPSGLVGVRSAPSFSLPASLWRHAHARHVVSTTLQISCLQNRKNKRT